jgi:hypothetical protein
MQGLSPKQIEEAVRLYEAGWSLARIGTKLGVDAGTVQAGLRERGVKMRDAHGRARSPRMWRRWRTPEAGCSCTESRRSAAKGARRDSAALMVQKVPNAGFARVDVPHLREKARRVPVELELDASVLGDPPRFVELERCVTALVTS